jgi:type II secretory pathway component GspD/PulD (secretin)
MIVQPQISSIDQTTSVPISTGVSAPVINVRSADTVAVTPDGQTVIIGGLMGDIKAETESKIPVLGDIPLLGSLFKRKTKTGTKTELLIFLTPHIVLAPTELAALTEVERKKAADRKQFSEKELDTLLESVPMAQPAAPSGKP